MAMDRATSEHRIIRDPDVMVGKPVVKGTRIPVEKVLGQLAYKLDLEELFAIYPDLTIEDVQSCLAYAKAAVAAKKDRPASDLRASATPA